MPLNRSRGGFFSGSGGGAITGLAYNSGTGEIEFSAHAKFNSGKRLFLSDGSAADPSLSFDGDRATGAHRSGVSDMRLGAGSSAKAQISAGGLTSLGSFTASSTANLNSQVIFGSLVRLTPTVKTSSFTATGTEPFLVFRTGTGLTCTLPAPGSTSGGTRIVVHNDTSTALTIGRNGGLILGVAADISIPSRGTAIFLFSDATTGWAVDNY